MMAENRREQCQNGRMLHNVTDCYTFGFFSGWTGGRTGGVGVGEVSGVAGVLADFFCPLRGLGGVRRGLRPVVTLVYARDRL